MNKVFIPLIVVVSVALIGAGILGFYSYAHYEAAEKCADELKKQKQTIDTILAEVPSPTQRNVDEIRKDIALIKAQTQRSLPVYGNPQMKVYDTFLAELKADPAAFTAAWNMVRDSEFKDGKTADCAQMRTLFASFMKDGDYIKKFQPADVEYALKKATAVWAKTSVDTSPESVLNALLSAIQSESGLTTHDCRKFINTVVPQMIAYLSSAPHKIKLPDEPVGFYFTFNTYKDQLPQPEAVTDVLTRLSFFGDIVVQMKEAGITNFRKLSTPVIVGQPDTAAKTVVGKDFQVTRFVVEVEGTQKSIRDFYNRIIRGTDRNRFYVVTAVGLKKANDDVSAYVNREQTSSSRGKEKAKPVEVLAQNPNVILTLDVEYIKYAPQLNTSTKKAEK